MSSRPSSLSHVSYDEQAPTPPNPWQLLTTVNTPGVRWPGALRAAIALGIPGVIALAFGSHTGMLMVAAGSCAVIYGEGKAYRERWKIIAIAGALLIVGVVLGSALGHVVFSHYDNGGSRWWLLLVGLYASLIAAVGSYTQNALRLAPPGSFFMVMTAGGAAMAAHMGLTPQEVGGWATLGVCSALIVGMFPRLFKPDFPEASAVSILEKSVDALRENPSFNNKHQAVTALANAWTSLSDAGILSHQRVVDPGRRSLVERTQAAQLALAGIDSTMDELDDADQMTDVSRTAIPHSRPTIVYRIYRALSPYSHPTITGTQVFLTAFGSAVVSVACGFDRPDWAAVSAMLILQWGPDRIPGSIRGIHRFLGTIVGIGVFALLHMAGLNDWWVLGFLMLTQFFAEILVVRNYALCNIVTTPLALLMGGAILKPLDAVVFDRFMETLISVVVSLAVIWFTPNLLAHRHHQRLVRRCYDSMSSLLGSLLTMTPEEAISQRRMLQYELLSERRAAASLARNEPQLTPVFWENHLHLQRAGYQILDTCTAAPRHNLNSNTINQLAEDVRTLRPVLPS